MQHRNIDLGFLDHRVLLNYGQAGLCLYVKDSEVHGSFTEFLRLTEQRAEFGIFISSVMNVGFKPATLVSSHLSVILVMHVAFSSTPALSPHVMLMLF